MRHGAGTIDDQMHSPICVEFTFRDQPLDFDNGSEGLAIDFTFLHGKRIGQEFLEGFAIEAGVRTHARNTTILRLHCWVGERAEPVSRANYRSLSPGEMRCQ